MVATMRRYVTWAVWLSFSVLLCGFSTAAQSQGPPIVQGAENGRPETRVTGASAAEPLRNRQPPGSISGKVVDQSPSQEALSDQDGRFAFANVAPGPFQVAITLEGFSAQASSGVLQSGEIYLIPQITLALATAVTEVRVVPARTEVAEDQIKEQEKQRVLGVIPNFYVSYDHHAVPLTSKQKFELAWKTTVDPVSFGVVGATA